MNFMIAAMTALDLIASSFSHKVLYIFPPILVNHLKKHGKVMLLGIGSDSNQLVIILKVSR